MLPAELDAARQLVRQALLEDLNGGIDITTSLLIAPTEQGTVQIVARQQGVLSGGQIIPLVFEQIDPDVSCRIHVADGTSLTPGIVVATLEGSVPALLTGERTILNFLTLLSGTASLTRKYVAEVESTQTKILDTRKTLPGLRTLQKYAVRCGGGTNHRIGLYDAVLVKDNHLAAWRSDGCRSLAEAVRHVRKSAPPGMTIEFEVDMLDQLREILPEQPDIVLLDNMTIGQLAEAVRMRNELAGKVLLEASGGVNLQTVGKIAATGVDRISIGALTHSAPALDLGFDWV